MHKSSWPPCEELRPPSPLGLHQLVSSLVPRDSRLGPQDPGAALKGMALTFCEVRRCDWTVPPA